MKGYFFDKFIAPTKGGGQSLSTYWLTRYISELSVLTTSDTEQTVTATITGTGYDGVSYEYSTDGVTYSVKGTSANGTYLATGLTRGIEYFWRARLYKGTNYSSYSSVVSSWTSIITLLADGHTKAWHKPLADGGARRNATTFQEDIYYDMLVGSASRGAEQSSGAIVLFAVYEITATQANFFYTGCVVGAIFVCQVVKTCDANNKVKRVLGNHLCAGSYPINRIFDGINDYMKTAPFTYDQPEFVYIVIRQISWTNGEVILCGHPDASLVLYQATTTPGLSAYAGVGADIDNGLAVNSLGIVRILYNGANSSFQINAGSIWTGNLGTNNAGGITLGRYGTTSTAWANFEFVEAIYRDQDDNATDKLAFYNYLINNYFYRDWTALARYASNPIISHGTELYNGFGTDTPYINIENKIGDTYYALSQVSETDGTTWNNFALYTSTDLLNWTDHGIVFSAGASGAWDDEYIVHPTVIKIGDTFHLYYSAQTGATSEIGHATSTDFINWTKDAANPVYSGNGTAHAYSPCVILIGSTYYMYYWNGLTSAAKAIEYATSPDGLTWTYGGIALFAPIASDWDYFAGNGISIDPWVIKNKHGYYEMVYSAVNVGADQKIGHAISFDGKIFRKHQAVVMEGSGSGFDETYVGDPVLLEKPDGTTYLYYVGMSGAYPGTATDGGLAILTP